MGEFIWDEVTQSFILSSFFWGYLLSQTPGGRVAELYGVKKVFGGAIIFCGILSLLVPYAAHGHWTLLLIIRALQGISLVIIIYLKNIERFIKSKSKREILFVRMYIFICINQKRHPLWFALEKSTNLFSAILTLGTRLTEWVEHRLIN